MTDHTTDCILYALYCLSRDTCEIDATELARAVGVSPTLAASTLVTLERTGLVDATRARLTMLGLARAAALGARGSGGPAVDLARAKPRIPVIASTTVAAGASEPAGAPAANPERPSHHDAHDAHDAHDTRVLLIAAPAPNTH